MDLGKSIMDLFKSRRKQEFADAASPDYSPEAAEFDDPGDSSGFYMTLKKKRRATVLKQMLNDAGYTDLAKMMNIRER